MHDMLRERLWRNLESLPEERLYQVLDYIEFLNSKYAREGVRAPVSPLRKFGERLEDHMRLQGVGLNAIKGTIGAVGTADRMFSGLSEAGRSLLKEVEQGIRTATEPRDHTEVGNLPTRPADPPEGRNAEEETGTER